MEEEMVVVTQEGVWGDWVGEQRAVGWVEEERVVVAEEVVEGDWVGEERAVEVQEGLEVEGRMGAGLGEAVKVGAEEKTRSWGADRTNLKARPAGQTFLRSHKVAVETICNCSFS